MSRMKDYLLDQIDKLSKESGYSSDDLLDIWDECMDEGQSWEFFKTVTQERDW